MSFIVSLTNGADIALIKNNAFIGAQISSELGKLREQQRKDLNLRSTGNEGREFDHTIYSHALRDKKGDEIYDKIGKSECFRSSSVKTDLNEKKAPFEVNIFF